LATGRSTRDETRDLASRSDCHAWSAHPNYDLLTIVAGIKPGAPGFKKARIELHLGSLDRRGRIGYQQTWKTGPSQGASATTLRVLSVTEVPRWLPRSTDGEVYALE
jgi:hypothetical protein